MTQRLIIVTGASRGIGAAIAHALAAAGHEVGCLSRSGAPPAIQGAAEEICARWHPVAADVTDGAAFRRAIDDLASRGWNLAGLVNNAGFHVESPAASTSIDEWNAVIAGNATSTMIGCQAAYPHLKGSGGLIVNIGSYFDKLGVKRNLAYSASKAAVGAISRVLAVEWARDRISVVNVAPGFILTDLNRAEWEEGPLRTHLEARIPRRAPGRPEEVASLVAALFAMDTKFLTGETIYIDGAQSLVA